MTTTATIETLTAEVRTLVVESRQITMSVAKQLDTVPIEQLRIFGRVHISKNSDYVIGADEHGALALAHFSRHPAFPHPFIDEEDLEGGHIIVCAHEMQDRGQIYRLSFSGQTIDVAARVTELCGIEGHSWQTQKCETWNTNGLHDLIDLAVQSQLARHSAIKAAHKAAAASPLIVLAGLR